MENPVEHEANERRRRAELSGGIYSVLFLVIVTFAVDWALSAYLRNLVRRGEIGRFTYLVRLSDAALAVAFLLELIVVMACYRLGPLRMTLREMGLTASERKFRELGWGFLTGLLVYAASLPILFKVGHHGITDLIIGNFYHAQIILVAILYAVLLPAASEIVHRGVIFKSFLVSANLPSALLLNAVVFAVVWPLHNWMVGFLLGVATALLYYRFRSVVAPIVANVVLTCGCAATLVFRELHDSRYVP
jgi:hypothetical protein